MTESFNKSVVIVGPAEYGKTTAARAEVDEHLREFESGLVFVHDCNLQFRDYAKPYADVAAWKAAAAAAELRVAGARLVAKPGVVWPRGASIGGDAAALTREVIELGKRFNTADATRVPILLVYDESSLMGTSGQTFMGEQDVQLLSNRRHWGIGVVYNVQEVTALTRAFYSRATKVVMFSQPSEDDTEKLRKYLGLPAHALDELVQAPPFKYRVWRRGQGLVGPSSRRAA